MKRKSSLITILIILSILFSSISGILGNIVSSTLQVGSYFQYAWIPFVVVTLLLIAFAVWQNRLQSKTEIPTPTLRKQYRQLMLDRVRTFWIKGVLEQSLHGAVLMVLGLQEQPNAIENPWRLVLQQPDQIARLLPSGTHITQIYDDAGRELLILGEPGSGKTTLLLELARDLLDRAQTDDTHPMPVVFNLSSWAARRQSFSDWFIEELYTRYQVPHNIAEFWIKNDQVLPLLDGLDEVAQEHLAGCIEAINSYRQKHMVSMAICSRSNEYLTQQKHLSMQRAVIVQPLTKEQIEDYLLNAGGQLEALRVALQSDSDLQELSTTPLMLSVLTLAYHGRSAKDLLTESSPEIQRRHVFTTYTERMLHRRTVQARYKPQQAIRWLTWLASYMTDSNRTQFQITDLKINSLPKDFLPTKRKLYFYSSIFSQSEFSMVQPH